MTKESWINSQQKLEIFCFSIVSRLAVSSAEPLTERITRPVSMEIKQQEHEIDQSPLPIAEVRIGGATYALSHPPYILMAESKIN
jgi:hypothetical protein